MPLTIPVENWALRKSPRSSMGSRSCRSCQTKRPPSSAARTKRLTISAEAHPCSAPKVMAERRAATAGKKMARPVQSKRTRASRFRLRGTSRMAATAPKMPKGTLTKKMRRHPPAASSRPPTVGPIASPRACAAPCNPMARPSAPTRHHEHDDGQAVRLQHGGPDGLQRTKAAQRREVGREPAQNRRKREDDEAIDVEELAAPHVREASDGGHRGHQDEQVGEAHPRDGTDRRVEGVLEGGKGDGHDGRVELAHECADTHGGDGEPVGVGPLSDRLGPPRLDEQPVPGQGPRTRRFRRARPGSLARPVRVHAAAHASGSARQATSALALMSRDEAPTSTS